MNCVEFTKYSAVYIYTFTNTCVTEECLWNSKPQSKSKKWFNWTKIKVCTHCRTQRLILRSNLCFIHSYVFQFFLKGYSKTTHRQTVKNFISWRIFNWTCLWPCLHRPKAKEKANFFDACHLLFIICVFKILWAFSPSLQLSHGVNRP